MDRCDDGVIGRIVPLLVCMFAAGCQPSERKNEPSLSVADVQSFRKEYPGLTEQCLQRLREGGIEAMPDDSDDCFKFDDARRWAGVWEHYMEHSTFCAEGTAPCPDDPKDALWLEFTGPEPLQGRYPPGGRFTVEFIGRRNVGQGAFGHAGVYRNAVIVDRMISIKEVGESAAASPFSASS